MNTSVPSIAAAIICALLVGIGIARIAATYPVFSQTVDEPAHIAAGMEWLDHGTYRYEPHHPPLARIAAAIGPYLAGLRLSDSQRGYLDTLAPPVVHSSTYTWSWRMNNTLPAQYLAGDEILDTGTVYFRNLTLARLGILPFFIAAAVLVWLWSRSLFGDTAAVLSLLMFTTLPVILAHAGVATTDMALTATFLAAMFAFTRWLARPTIPLSVVLGLSVALAILSKFSTLLFIPACVLAILAWRYLPQRHLSARSNIREFFRMKTLGLVILATAAMLWAGYQFSLGSLLSADDRPHELIDRTLGGEGALRDAAYMIAEARIVPAVELFQGIHHVAEHNAQGHPSFLLGEARDTGWWYFFPVALAVKTPLPFLILSAAGILALVYETRRTKAWEPLVPAICAAAILLACLPSSINIGVRHVLPVYPLLAIMAGYGALRVWQAGRARYLGPTAVAALLSWQLASSIQAHPDYLAYFNEVAGRHPERILSDSDLDWGQDLKRLADAVRARGITDIAIGGWTPKQIARQGVEYRPLRPNQTATGWIAIRVQHLKTNDGFQWLEAYEPDTVIGKSIFLYYIPDSTPAASEGAGSGQAKQ